MSSVTDPYELLGQELARAAAALDAADTVIAGPAATAPMDDPRSHARRLRRWSSRHLLATVLIAGATAATAAAGVVAALSGTVSPPPSGQLVGAATSPGGTQPIIGAYRVSLSPWDAVGQTAWCVRVQLRTARDGGSAGAGCGPAATRRFPFIAGGSDAGGGGGVSYAIVDERVATLVGPQGERLAPRTDPTLPFGWKYAIDVRPIQPKTTATTPRGFPSMPVADLYNWTPLDASGHRVGGPPLSPHHDAADFVGRQRPLLVRNGAAPDGTSCEITRRDGSPWRRGHPIYRVLARPAEPQPTANGRPFLSCAQLTIPTQGKRLTASVLIDARSPGRRPAALPAMTPGIDGSGHLGNFGDSEGIVGSAVLQRSAKRVGDAWLVVLGLSPKARGALLRELTVRTNLPPA